MNQRSGKTYFGQSYVWYKLCVYYHAQTEVYDRMLTSLRSPHDPTEAYITEGSVKRFSMLHARQIRELIYEVADRFGIPYDIRLTGLRGNTYPYSAQQWIDEYDRLVEAGEMDFIKEFWECNYGRKI